MFRLLEFGGNPHIGVFARTNETHSFVAPGQRERDYKEVAEALETQVVQLTVGGGNLVGSLLAANGRCALVADIATEKEIAAIEATGLEVAVFAHRLNAVGNNVLVSDRAALIHPEMGPGEVKLIRDAFDVEVVKGSIAGVPTVGMAAVLTAKGLIVHPKATDEERNRLRELFGHEAVPVTVNHGTPYVGAGLIANSKGAVCGRVTTGIELGRIEEGLNLA